MLCCSINSLKRGIWPPSHCSTPTPAILSQISFNQLVIFRDTSLILGCLNSRNYHETKLKSSKDKPSQIVQSKLSQIVQSKLSQKKAKIRKLTDAEKELEIRKAQWNLDSVKAPSAFKGKRNEVVSAISTNINNPAKLKIYEQGQQDLSSALSLISYKPSLWLGYEVTPKDLQRFILSNQPPEIKPPVSKLKPEEKDVTQSFEVDSQPEPKKTPSDEMTNIAATTTTNAIAPLTGYQVCYSLFSQIQSDWLTRLSTILGGKVARMPKSSGTCFVFCGAMVAYFGFFTLVLNTFFKYSFIMKYQIQTTVIVLAFCGGVTWGFGASKFGPNTPLLSGMGRLVIGYSIIGCSVISMLVAGISAWWAYDCLRLTTLYMLASDIVLHNYALVPHWLIKWKSVLAVEMLIFLSIGKRRGQKLESKAETSLFDDDLEETVISTERLVMKIIPKKWKDKYFTEPVSENENEAPAEEMPVAQTEKVSSVLETEKLAVEEVKG